MAPTHPELASHWDAAWSAADPAAKSWYEADARRAMALIEPHLTPGARVVDVGAGASVLADALIEAGADVTLVDISANALAITRERLDARGLDATFVVADVTDWTPTDPYDLWHDRATLHFLVDDAGAHRYVDTATRAVRPGGVAIINTFGPDGPTECSGLPTRRRSTAELTALFAADFDEIDSSLSTHRTPTGATQEFATVTLRRRG